MLKTSSIVLIFFSIFFLCIGQKETHAIIQNQKWLVTYIDQIEKDNVYYGVMIYLNEWNDHYYYDVFVAQRLCAVCEVYDIKGELVSWDDTSALDYNTHRTEISVIWEWEKNN